METLRITSSELGDPVEHKKGGAIESVGQFWVRQSGSPMPFSRNCLNGPTDLIATHQMENDNSQTCSSTVSAAKNQYREIFCIDRENPRSYGREAGLRIR
jgi:hypothetical protein